MTTPFSATLESLVRLRGVRASLIVSERDGLVVDEHGSRVDLDQIEPGVRVWADFDTVHRLVNEGRGEAVCWNGEAIHWRHRVVLSACQQTVTNRARDIRHHQPCRPA